MKNFKQKFEQIFNSSKKYFNITIKNIRIKDILFLAIIGLYFFNGLQNYYLHRNSIVTKKLDQYELARIDNKSYLNNLENNDYTEVFLKSHQYKKTDEIIIDTSGAEEEQKSQKNQYIEYYQNNKLQNWQIWINCYLGDSTKKNKCFNNE